MFGFTPQLEKNHQLGGGATPGRTFGLNIEKHRYSRVLVWRIPGTGKPGGLPSVGSHRVRHDREELHREVLQVARQYCACEVLRESVGRGRKGYL